MLKRQLNKPLMLKKQQKVHCDEPSNMFELHFAIITAIGVPEPLTHIHFWWHLDMRSIETQYRKPMSCFDVPMMKHDFCWNGLNPQDCLHHQFWVVLACDFPQTKDPWLNDEIPKNLISQSMPTGVCANAKTSNSRNVFDLSSLIFEGWQHQFDRGINRAIFLLSSIPASWTDSNTNY